MVLRLRGPYASQQLKSNLFLHDFSNSNKNVIFDTLMLLGVVPIAMIELVKVAQGKVYHNFSLYCQQRKI